MNLSELLEKIKAAVEQHKVLQSAAQAATQAEHDAAVLIGKQIDDGIAALHELKKQLGVPVEVIQADV